MIDALYQSLISRIIELLKYRQENSRRLFDTFVDPIYRDADAVATDYMEVLAELVIRLEKGDEEIPEILRWLELRRSRMISTRAKLRALLFDGSPEMTLLFPPTLARKFSDPLLKKFIDGISGILAGCLSLTDNGHIRIGAYPFEKFGLAGGTGHTIIDIFESFSVTDKPRAIRSLLAHNARRQQGAVLDSLRTVVQAKNELRVLAHK